DMVNVRCCVPGCSSLAAFGYEGGVLQACSLHQLDGHVLLRSKRRSDHPKGRCARVGCNLTAAYGSRFTRTRRHCHLHKTDDEVSLYARK
ncbi:hypothetical protein GUITHDRAFT_51093, partial [Guillardia theta CCMP2712]